MEDALKSHNVAFSGDSLQQKRTSTSSLSSGTGGQFQDTGSTGTASMSSSIFSNNTAAFGDFNFNCVNGEIQQQDSKSSTVETLETVNSNAKVSS